MSRKTSLREQRQLYGEEHVLVAESLLNLANLRRCQLLIFTDLLLG